MTVEEIKKQFPPTKIDVQGYGIVEIYSPKQVLGIAESYKDHCINAITDEAKEKLPYEQWLGAKWFKQKLLNKNK